MPDWWILLIPVSMMLVSFGVWVGFKMAEWMHREHNEIKRWHRRNSKNSGPRALR